MRRIFLSVLALVCAAACLQAFDWVPKTNEELFDDMMAYARENRDQVQCIPAAGKLWDKFIAKQPGTFENDPYAWIGNAYKLVYSLEKIVPPHLEDGSNEAIVRRHMFRLLDFPIHVYEKGPDATDEEKRAFIIGRTYNWDQGCERVVAALNKPAPAPGTLEILKLYNMGYVLRTSEHCIGIDLCFHSSEALADKLAGKLDVMFVTHPHGDHFTKVMLQSVIDAGKKLVLSKEYGPEDVKGNKIVTWENIIDTPLEVCGIKVRTIKGHQNKQEPAKMPNNVYYLEFDGFKVLHHGDNSDKTADKALSALEAPDLAFVASWNKPQLMMNIFRDCKHEEGRNTLFIASHENEYGHRVQQRESYWETYTRKDRYGNPEFNYYPWMTMECGEVYYISR